MIKESSSIVILCNYIFLSQPKGKDIVMKLRPPAKKLSKII